LPTRSLHPLPPVTVRHALLPLSLSILVAAGLVTPQQTEIRATAAADAPHGVLAFGVVDRDGRTMPSRLTFFPAGETQTRDLFPGVDAAQGELAVRKNVIYSATGLGQVTVPVGEYDVYATRGIEWSRGHARLTIRDGEKIVWTPVLEHELDTEGWVGGDFHLHTLTHSGHGDSNLPERIVSLIGEGVEFAVATDHNHNTDYGPTIAEVGAGAHVTAVVGNEVSTPVGHFNAFPLDASRPVIDASLDDANELFRLIRAEPNAFDVPPVVQLNHPRWDGIDYFAQAGFDPVTGTSDDPDWSSDFDCLEVLNENVGWGWFEKHVDGEETSANRHSVLRDWYHLLDRGHRATAVGNSDSHTVHYAFAGYPRNLVHVGADDPGAIDPATVAAAIRSGRLCATTGPVLDVRAGDVPMGGTVTAEEGRVRFEIEVQSASWIACDRLEVGVNGDTAQTLALLERDGALHAVHAVELALDADAWIVVLAEGDEPLAPIVPNKGGRPAYPIGIANPLRVDADGDGTWTPPFDTAAARVDALARTGKPLPMLEAFAVIADLPPSEAARWILTSAEQQVLPALACAGLGSPHRTVRLASARALERFAPLIAERADETQQRTLATVVANAWWWCEPDPYLEVALLRVLLQSPDFTEATPLAHVHARLVERYGADVLAPYLHELERFYAGRPVTGWRVLGTFDAPEQGRATQLGPERAYAPDATYPTRDGEQGWRDVETDTEGYLDLTDLAQEGQSTADCFAYAETWLHAPQAMDALVGLGTDDGGRVYVNGDLFHEDLDRQGASPLQHVKQMPLQKGWNRIVFQVENGGGAYGLYFRLLDERVESARRPGA